MAEPSASPVMEFDAVPLEEFDAIPLEPEAQQFDAVPLDPEPAQRMTPELEAQVRQGTAMGLQLFDIATLPGRLDWSEAAADEVIARRQRANELYAQAQAPFADTKTFMGVGVTPYEDALKIHRGYTALGNQEATKADELEARLQAEAPQSPGAINLRERRAAAETLPSFAPSAATQISRGLLGRVISSQIEPMLDSAVRSVPAATGGVLGAASFMVPGGGLLRFLAPLAGGFGGAQIGGAASEVIQQKLETPEETARRHQQIAIEREQHPFATMAGEGVSQIPFLRPSLRELARAFTGDWAARRNIGIGATIGAGSEVVSSWATGQDVDPTRVAGAMALGGLFNTPTALGRRIGLPANEFAAEVPPPQIEYPTTTPDAQQISLTSTPDGGVRPPEVTGENAPLPPTQGGEGIQPGGQGERVAPPASEQAQPAPVKSEFISSDFFNRFDTGKGIDLDQGAQALTTKVDQALKSGAKVTLLADMGRKEVPITSVELGMMTDAQGQRWGVMSMATSRGKEGVKIEYPQQAQSTPNGPKPKVTDIVPAIRIGDEVIRGNPGETHRDILNRWKQGRSEEEQLLAEADFDAPKRNPNFFLDAQGNEISRERLKELFGVTDSQGLAKLQAEAAPKPLSPEQIATEANQRGFQYTGATTVGRKTVHNFVDTEIVPGARVRFQIEGEVTPEKLDQRKVAQAPALPSSRPPNTVRLFHATAQRFEKFDPSKGEFWLAATPEGAEARTRKGASETAAVDVDISGLKRIPFEGRSIPDILDELPREGAVLVDRDGNIDQVILTGNERVKQMQWTGKESVPPPPATPPPTAEAVTPEPNVTSIKNARVDEERAQRGLPPMDEVVPVSDREVWERARVMEEADPRAADRLIEQLSEKPRSLNSEETMLLIRKRVQLSNDFAKADDAVVAAKEAGDPTALEAAEADRNAASDALTKLEEVHGRGGAGTEQGRAFRLRQLFMREDYSLERMTTALRAEQGGAPLSEAQVTKLREQAQKITQTQQGMDQILAAREAAEKAEGSLDPRVRSLADRIIARLDLSAKNAAQSLRSRLGKLGSAPDPLIVLDVAKIAAAKTAKSAIQFAQWSAEMIKEFGEKVRPFLKAGWDQREQHIDSEVSTTVGTKRKTRTAAEKEQSAVKARLTALANRTAKLKGRTAAQDFSPLRKAPADLSKNPEWVRLKAENDAAKADFEKARYEARRAQRTTEQKVRDTVADTWAASRPILASMDISAPGRQGIFFSLPDLFTNPVRLGRQLKAMFGSQFSEKQFQKNEAEIKSRENADIYESSGLYLADIDHKPSAREESFKSELAEKIPLIGRLVRGSNRGFSSLLNRSRADSMDTFIKWSGGRENVNPETAQFLASAINDLTGRGNVSSRQAQGALEWLAKYLFSPRLWVSRFNTATLKPIWRDPLNRAISPRARAVVAGQYVKFIGALMALKWLAGLNGGKMELDPRDSDFGKLQFGTKRYDVMGGIGNMVTLLARIATQKTKDDKGKVLRIAWQDEKRPEREMGQILFNHLRNKAAPIPGAIYDFIYGRHPDRSKVTPLSMVKQTTVPITISDTLEYFKKNPPLPAIRDTIINALGISTQDYRK